MNSRKKNIEFVIWDGNVCFQSFSPGLINVRIRVLLLCGIIIQVNAERYSPREIVPNSTTTTTTTTDDKNDKNGRNGSYFTWLATSNEGDAYGL